MSTANKLTYLNTTKGKIKDAINLTNANILSEDTFRSYAEKLKLGLIDIINNGTDDLYDSFPKTTGEGTEIALNDTYEAPMDIGLNGNTHQDSYTGINLLTFPYYETTKTVNGITFTVKDDGTIHAQGTASAKTEFLIRNRDINLNITEGETYTLATSGLGTIDSTIWLDTSGQTGNFLDKWALTQNTPYTSAVAQSKDIKPFIRISVKNGATVNSDVKVWLYKGTYSSSITYEPYVGGIPSPNPDFPQPIEVVTGDNTINVHGKNLFNYNVIDVSTITIDNDGTILISGTQSSNGYTSTNKTLSQLCPSLQVGDVAYLYLETDFYENGELKNIINIGERWRSGTTKTITQAMLNTNVIIYGGYQTTSHLKIMITNQIEQGSATPYQPYQSKNYEINLGNIELCKIGDYQDYIYKDNGSWYKKGYVRHISLNVSDMNRSEDYPGWSDVPYLNSDYPNQNIPNFPTSDLITNIGGSRTYFGLNTKGTNGILIMNKNAWNLTQTQWKTNYPNLIFVLYYALATPINTEITDTDLIEQLDELEKAKSVDDKTFISQINEQLSFILDVSALSKN